MSDRHTKNEHKWAHDENLQFKVVARRNKLLGLWAAGVLGLGGDEAETYAKSVVASDMKEPGEEDVFRKVAGDFAAKGVAVSGDAIRQKMAELMGAAREQVKPAD